MPAQQLHLFAPARPLLQRFGAGFFRAVPPKPGVYIMGGEAECVLYIGQSKNLRRRLGAYKNARLDRAPRKIIRLVHSVRTIVWEECSTAEAARLKENQLLRTHRPRFNVQNTFPQAYQFIGLQADDKGLSLDIGAKPRGDENIHGAFKAGCIMAFGALLRIVWAALHQTRSPHDFPVALAGPRPPRRYLFECGPNFSSADAGLLAENLRLFLSGEPGGFIDVMRQRLSGDESIAPFQRNLQSNDLELLVNFFERGPKRNQGLRRQYEIPEKMISQSELDDLLAMASVPISDPLAAERPH